MSKSQPVELSCHAPEAKAVQEQHMHGLNHDEVARLAYQFWEERGRPCGSSEIDWWRAEQELLGRPETTEPGGNRQVVEASPRSLAT